MNIYKNKLLPIFSLFLVFILLLFFNYKMSSLRCQKWQNAIRAAISETKSTEDIINHNLITTLGEDIKLKIRKLSSAKILFMQEDINSSISKLKEISSINYAKVETIIELISRYSILKKNYKNDSSQDIEKNLSETKVQIESSVDELMYYIILPQDCHND